MPQGLTIVFFEDAFVCTILPNESAWETLRIDDKERIPLVFHVENGSVRNDDFAAERWRENDPRAFGDFYRLLCNNTPFRRFDLDLPPIELLHDVVERVETQYEERMRAFETPSSATARIPLHLCFLSDILPEARQQIREYLRNRGFDVQPEVEYREALLRGMHLKGLVPSTASLMLLSTAFGDVRLDYIEWEGGIRKDGTHHVAARGVDRRVGVLAWLLVHKAAKQTTSTLLNDQAMFDAEVRQFHSIAERLLGEFKYDVLDTRVVLSVDSRPVRVRVKRGEVDERTAEAIGVIALEFDQLLGRHSTLARLDRVMFDGAAITTPEFLQFFRKKVGAIKVIEPLQNIAEVVSRGVFALSRALDSLHDVGSAPAVPPLADGDVLEIKITLTKTPAPPPPVPPPMPGRPSLPPVMRMPVTSRPEMVSVAPPPIPPRPPAPAAAQRARLPLPPSVPPKAPVLPKQEKAAQAPPVPPPRPLPSAKTSRPPTPAPPPIPHANKPSDKKK